MDLFYCEIFSLLNPNRIYGFNELIISVFNDEFSLYVCEWFKFYLASNKFEKNLYNTLSNNFRICVYLTYSSKDSRFNNFCSY